MRIRKEAQAEQRKHQFARFYRVCRKRRIAPRRLAEIPIPEVAAWLKAEEPRLKIDVGQLQSAVQEYARHDGKRN